MADLPKAAAGDRRRPQATAGDRREHSIYTTLENTRDTTLYYVIYHNTCLLHLPNIFFIDYIGRFTTDRHI